MRTQKQIAASRENGGKSHGAATVEGKARIVNANLQTGIVAETQVLIWEFQVEDALWDELFTASPQNLDACAYALQQGDQTFTRLQHRINSTRRAFHTALKELERLEARDQDVVLVNPDPVSPVTQTPETQLQILGSLRKNDPGHPAPGETPPTPVQEHRSTGESVFGIGGPATASWQHSRP